ncbi:GNAT family N-acetyltransferase [Tistrella mobilis]|uniref:GNAT family N-acetyltransferase n=1 Tax=Tistrella mobilis TaxID=171437 RepID=UPI0035577A50
MGAVLDLIHKLALNEDSEEMVARVFTATTHSMQEHGFSESPAFECRIAEFERNGAKTIVGIVIFYQTYSSYTSRLGLYIEDLFVEAAARGKGAGRALLQEVARIAQDRACTRVDLAVLSSNPARGFYHRLGFQHRTPFLFYRLTDSSIGSLAEGTSEDSNAFHFRDPEAGGEWLTASVNPPDDGLSELERSDAAIAVVTEFSDCFNARDIQGVEACLQFPHLILSGEKLSTWDGPGAMTAADFDALANGSGWYRSVYHRIDPILTSPRKVHLVVEYSRETRDGFEISRHRNVWTVTFEFGRWGIKQRSY